jgi:hypothetical protein
MAQYVTYALNELVEYTDGTETYREGSRNNSFVLDKEITALGFSGVENNDWENLWSKVSVGLTGKFRDGVRSGAYVIDETITGTGFAGTENVDWINVETLS